MKYTIATRGSKLALCQTEMVQKQLRETFPAHQWDFQIITTTGDRILDQPLSNFGGKGVFLKEIEEALLSSKADLAVHSLKDVPAQETAGLRLSAFLVREDPRDVWASYQEELMHLPAGKKVGTSSLRRKLLVQFYRPDLNVDLLRGNLDTRLRKLREGQYDAVVVAAAGLHRLGLLDHSYMHYLSEDAFIPAIGQGVITIQTRSDSEELNKMIGSLSDSATATAARIERSFLARFEGGCYLPVGALATHQDGKWKLHAFIGGARTGRIIQDSVMTSAPNECSSILYEKLLSLGAQDLLKELEPQ